MTSECGSVIVCLSKCGRIWGFILFYPNIVNECVMADQYLTVKSAVMVVYRKLARPISEI